MTGDTPLHIDVAIVGGGLAGTALAALLGGSRMQVALIEADAPSTVWPALSTDINHFDTRVSALNLHSQRLLTATGAWQEMVAQRVSAYRHMHVWDAEGTGAIDFDAADINLPTLGYIVENRITHIALRRQLARHTNLRLIAGTASALDVHGERPQLTLSDGRQLSAALIVGADGAQSRIRQWAHFLTREWDYDHQAIVATVRTGKPHQQTAWQRFLPEGPLAFLPLPGGDGRFCSIVWSAQSACAHALLVLDGADFCHALARAFEYRLGAIEQVSERSAFPLRQRHAVDYVQPGIALVADAAHTIHPLAGQGINLGFKDVAVLAEEVRHGAERGLSPGAASVLARYQRRRQGDNLAMMAAMDGFKRLFGSRDLTLRYLRNTGLRWVDGSGALKRALMRRAIGA